MRWKSLVHCIALGAFLPAATGCSSVRTASMRDDYSPEPVADSLAAGESLQIKGYRTRDGHHDWDGRVRQVGADSLEFTPRPEIWSDSVNTPRREAEDDGRFVLARDDVLALDVVTLDGGKTALAVVAGAALLVGVLAIAAIHAWSSAWNDSPLAD